MYESSLTPHQLLDLLAAAPGRLLALTEGLTPAQLRTPPQPGEWSLTEVLAHLRACADVWGCYIDTLLTQDAPTFRAVNPTTYMKQTDYPRLEFHLSLQAFTTQREALLGVLRTLAPEAYSRSATVITAGKPFQRTVHTYIEWLAVHERSHFKPIARIVDTVRG
jgi:hypothetical protein